MDPATLIVWLFVAVELLSALLAYLLFRRPMLFYERSIVPKWKAWGIEPRLVDEAKFRRMCRLMGWMIAGVALFIALVLFNACTIVRWTRTHG